MALCSLCFALYYHTRWRFGINVTKLQFVLHKTVYTAASCQLITLDWMNLILTSKVRNRLGWSDSLTLLGQIGGRSNFPPFAPIRPTKNPRTSPHCPIRISRLSAIFAARFRTNTTKCFFQNIGTAQILFKCKIERIPGFKQLLTFKVC